MPGAPGPRRTWPGSPPRCRHTHRAPQHSAPMPSSRTRAFPDSNPHGVSWLHVDAQHMMSSTNTNLEVCQQRGCSCLLLWRQCDIHVTPRSSSCCSFVNCCRTEAEPPLCQLPVRVSCFSALMSKCTCCAQQLQRLNCISTLLVSNMINWSADTQLLHNWADLSRYPCDRTGVVNSFDRHFAMYQPM